MTQEVLDHWDNSIDRAEHFEYDLTGNRTRLATDLNLDGIIDDLVTYHYDANDRLITELLDTGNNGTTDQTTTYTYDQTQQTSKTVTDQPQGASPRLFTRQSFTYNLQGRMNAVINDGFDANGTLNARERTSYTYDSRSFRINLTNETTSDFVSDPTDVTPWTLASRISFLAAHNNHTGYTQTLRETTTENGHTLITDYTFGHDEISQRKHGVDKDGNPIDETHIFGHDGHGSVRMLTDLAGTIAQVFTFSSYGVMLAVHNSAGLSSPLASRLSSLGYSGEHFDAKAQQQYLRARFYNPANGRFNRLDPFAGNNTDPQSFHKYAYTHGDPVNLDDPTGLTPTLGGMLSSLRIGLGIASRSAGAAFRVLKSVPHRLFSGFKWARSVKVGPRGLGGGLLLAYLLGRIGGRLLPQSRISITANGSPDIEGLTTAAEFTNALQTVAQNGGTITHLRIKSHAWANIMVDDDENELLVFGGDRIESESQNGLTRIDDELAQVTGPNSVIELRGCGTAQLARDVAIFLDNGTKVTGYHGFSCGIPFSEAHTGLSSTYSSLGGTLTEE